MKALHTYCVVGYLGGDVRLLSLLPVPLLSE